MHEVRGSSTLRGTVVLLPLTGSVSRIAHISQTVDALLNNKSGRIAVLK
jgi:hypothetical protein